MLCVTFCITGLCSLNAQDGSNAYNFLNITSSSKIYGLGGVNISLVDDELSTSDQNPALLGSEMSGQTVLSYMSLRWGLQILPDCVSPDRPANAAHGRRQ